MIINLQKRIFSFLFIIFFSCQAFANFSDYLNELDGKSGYSMSINTKKRLRSYNKNNVQVINKKALDEKHDEFTVNKKALITEWVKHNNKKWPTYKQNTNNRNAGDQYDAHHIIPQSHNGPNVWWNLFPLTNRRHHYEIHVSGSNCSILFPNSRGNGRNTLYGGSSNQSWCTIL